MEVFINEGGSEVLERMGHVSDSVVDDDVEEGLDLVCDVDNVQNIPQRGHGHVLPRSLEPT